MPDTYQSKFEICQLIAAISGSPRVSWIEVDSNVQEIRVVASTLGKARTFEIKYEIPGLTESRPIVIVPDVRALDSLKGHPIHEIVPNLHSLAAYLIEDSNGIKKVIVGWNPSAYFFESDAGLESVERIVELSRTISTYSALGNNPAKPVDKDMLLVGLEEPPPLRHSEPLYRFLMETLVTRQRLLSRAGVTYVAIRQWRKPIKEYQLKALEAIKSAETPAISEAVGKEIAEVVQRMYGGLFDAVVPIPGGSSGRERSFSVQIADAVARQLKVPCKMILQGGPVALGASHPKKSAKLADYKLKDAISGRVLVVDDVASSGKHIELAMKALKPHTDYCTAVTWIAD